MKTKQAEFARTVLCAMLISMLFSYVIACIDTKIVTVEWASVCAKFCTLVHGQKAPSCLLAGLWMFFYFGYLIDDYILPENEGAETRHVLLLVLAWTCFFGQVCMIWCPQISAVAGSIGLALLFCVVKTEKKRQWKIHCFENLFMIAVMALYIFGCTHAACFTVVAGFLMVVSKLCSFCHMVSLEEYKVVKNSPKRREYRDDDW